MHVLAYLIVPSLVSAAAIVRKDNPDNRAAYVLNVDPAGSSIVSLKVSVEDGSLSSPVFTPTGGKGLIGLTAQTTGPSTVNTVDALFSQDAVVVSQDYLFAVNSGSNTLSMFFINKDDPQHPTLVGKPASTKGEFPQTVAYSPNLKTACVLNGGATAGITCFSTDHAKGLTPLGDLRPLSLNQTTPPSGPPGTASDLVFNPSQTALIATIKGNGVDPGFIYAYPVEKDGSISTRPVLSRPAELNVNFAVSFIDDAHAIIVDPSFGSALVDVSSDLKFTVQYKLVVAGQKAICWSVYAPRFGVVFAIDAGTGIITIVDPQTGGNKGAISLDAPNGGAFDSKIDRSYLYVLRGTSAVSVLNTNSVNQGKTPQEVQTFDLSKYVPRIGLQGMAIYPSS
ncbi:hypothetical protein D0Z07_5393 [Hyphodiscus hymeniophilus]|uniref:3-carboxymuconate cyclase n=1 Tax=Hyphodiscus hymeniophilus TaxID=353542 RepID=A0A9P6VHP1_9HELO|nr:hypothetical protein D0Z07_5393 [Hyphodiscus hymeniophilus]